MKAPKSTIIKHVVIWVIVWLIQSLLFSGGADVKFYLVKNIAIVLLQVLVVYVNWFAIPRVAWGKSISTITYSSFSILLIYLVYAISFSVIGFTFSLFFSGIFRITSRASFWPSGFWTILSGSAPYSIAFLVSTIIYLIQSRNNHSKKTKENDIKEDESDSILTIKDGKTIHRMKKSEIFYVEGLKEYVNWHTSNQKIITLHPLHKIEESLKDEGFIRIHKSYIVNSALVTTVKYNTLEVSGKKIPIGRSYRSKVEQYFTSDM